MRQSAQLRTRAFIAPFPLTARSDLVRHCASELSKRHGQAAVDYWKSKCRALADELLDAGCASGEVGQAVLAFQDAVQMELRRPGHPD